MQAVGQGFESPYLHSKRLAFNADGTQVPIRRMVPLERSLTNTRDGERDRYEVIHASGGVSERHGSTCAECVRPCVVEVNEREHGLELAIIWSSEYGFTVDALELYGEEGRDKLR